MSLLSALFGKLAPAPAEKVPEPVEYKGFIIRPAPFKTEGQFQTAGTIEREIGGVRKEHRFIRADAFATFRVRGLAPLTSKAHGRRKSSRGTRRSWLRTSRPTSTSSSASTTACSSSRTTT